jgi:hypothetical protein
VLLTDGVGAFEKRHIFGSCLRRLLCCKNPSESLHYLRRKMPLSLQPYRNSAQGVKRKRTLRSQLNDGFGAPSSPPRVEACTRAFRPSAMFTAEPRMLTLSVPCSAGSA